MASIFSRIIAGEIPAHKVLENDSFFAFLDIMPLAPGHTLVVPKKEVDYLFDLEEDLLAGILPFSRRIAAALEQVFTCERIGVSVIGLEVPHAHVHLIPLRNMDDINFSRPKMKVSPAELADMAQKIRSALD